MAVSDLAEITQSLIGSIPISDTTIEQIKEHRLSADIAAAEPQESFN